MSQSFPMPPATIAETFALALQHHQTGRLAEAEMLYLQIVSAQPSHRGAMQNLGLIALQTRRFDAAIQWFQKTSGMAPDDASGQFNLGEAYRAASKFEPALACFRRALEIKPGYPEAHHRLGTVLAQLGRMDEAIVAYRRALALAPNSPGVSNELGIALAERGQHGEAIATFHRALETSADYPETHFNLGHALQGQGRLEEAVNAFRHALEIKPAWSVAWFKLADALGERGQFAEAVGAYRRGLQLEPSHPDGWNNLGNALFELAHHDDAATAYRRALELKPDYGEAHSNLAALLTERGDLDAAVAAIRHAATLMPRSAVIQNNLGNALKDAGLLDEALAAYRRAIELEPDYAMAHSNLIYSRLFQPVLNGEAIAAEVRQWTRQIAGPRRRLAQPHANERDPERKLVIGYVSSEFRDHVIGRNLAPLFESHDRRNFEIVCYSGTIRTDHLTRAFQQRSDRWREIARAPDAAVSQMIRNDGVDILVDLTQHLAGNRLPVFAHQPAPVQVSFAGYPASTGMESIPYRISDRYLESEIEDRRWEIGPELRTAEQVFLLDSFWCYHPCGVDVEINRSPALENEAVTFGCLNNFGKINERVLRCWGRILREVKDSRLLLLSPAGNHRQRALDILGSEGVRPNRIEFSTRRDRRSYLELHHRVDIALDPFPYNGHTTSVDALWMGVPVISLAGGTPVSRGGLSVLMNLDLAHFAAHSEADYTRIAIETAGDVASLDQLRQQLRARMEASISMDAQRFTRGIETVYRTMWRQWRLASPV